MIDGDNGVLEVYNNIFDVQITSSTVNASGTILYACTEQTFDPGTGCFSGAFSPRSTTTASGGPYLVEINNTQVATPCYAQARLRGIVGGQELYEFVATNSSQQSFYSGTISSGYQTDYVLPDASIVRINPTGAVTFNSFAPPLTASGKQTGREFELVNAASFPSAGASPNTLTMLHENLSGTASFRFNTPDGNPSIMQPQEAMKLKYVDGRWKFGELRPIQPYTSMIAGGSPPPTPLSANSVISGMIASGNALPYPTTLGPLNVGLTSGNTTPTSGYVNVSMFEAPVTTSGTGGAIPTLKLINESGGINYMTQSPMAGIIDGFNPVPYSGLLQGTNISGLTIVSGEIICFQSLTGSGQAANIGPWVVAGGSTPWIRPSWYQSGQIFAGPIQMYSVGDDDYLTASIDNKPGFPWTVGQDIPQFTNFQITTVSPGFGIHVTSINRSYTISLASGTVNITGQSGIIATATGPANYTIGMSYTPNITSGMIQSGAISNSYIFAPSVINGTAIISGTPIYATFGVNGATNPPNSWIGNITVTTTSTWVTIIDIVGSVALSGDFNVYNAASGNSGNCRVTVTDMRGNVHTASISYPSSSFQGGLALINGLSVYFGAFEGPAQTFKLEVEDTTAGSHTQMTIAWCIMGQ